MSQRPVYLPPDADIIENLSSDKPEARERAERAVEQMGPEAADRLLVTLNEEARKDRQQRASKRAKYLLIGAYFLFVVLYVAKPLNVEWTRFLPLFAIVAIAVGAVSRHPYHNAASKLAELEDTRAVGVLVEMLESNDAATRRVATRALCKLLPKLRASDSHLLNAHQRKILSRAFKKSAFGNDAAFALMILKAYEQVGDETALENVELLANVPPENSKVLQLLVIEAQGCLPALKTRVDQTRASQTLLRPSSATDVPSPIGEVLLRPALDAGATPSQELLRAAPNERTEHGAVLDRNPENPIYQERQAETPALLSLKGGEPT